MSEDLSLRYDTKPATESSYPAINYKKSQEHFPNTNSLKEKR